MNTINEKWEIFKHEVIPTEASDIQILEMKKSYYAGMYSMLQMQEEIFINPSINEDAAVALMECWQDECKRFFFALINHQSILNLKN